MTRSAGNPRKRRGVAVLVVMLVLAMTLALSYAVVRSQLGAVRIQRNADRSLAARAAAMSGAVAALQKMHTSGWAGVETTLAGDVGEYERFEASFTTGDAALSSSDPDYDEWPYRVTIAATGYAADPDRPQHVASHAVQLVVRLIPRALSPTPSGFSDLTDHTVCQWTAGDFMLTTPARIEGPVRVRATLDLALQIAWQSDPRWHYMDGLNRLRIAGEPDWRPFTGPVRMPYLWQYFDTRPLLNTALGVSTESTGSSAVYSWTSPSSVQPYRLYPGGKAYTPVTLPQDLRDTTLEADPQTNPLGLFYRAGLSRVYENVTLRGTLITLGGSEADVEFRGSDVQFTPRELPALAGVSEPIRLPTVVSADDMIVQKDSVVDLIGMVLVRDDFEVESEYTYGTIFNLTGRLAARDFYIRIRKDWVATSNQWQARWNSYWNQRTVPGGTDNFVVWLENICKSTPRITIRPDDQPIRYHWQNLNEPIFVPAAGDGGLRWEIVRWKENP